MTKIVVVGPNCWGAGKTLRQAVAKARINYPTFNGGSMPYNSYEASDDFTVDPFGSIEAQVLRKLSEVRYTDGKRVETKINAPVSSS